MYTTRITRTLEENLSLIHISPVSSSLLPPWGREV